MATTPPTPPTTETAPAADPNKPAEPAAPAAEPPAPATIFAPIEVSSLKLPEKLPEGVSLDGELGKEFIDLFNDPKLSRAELAQKIVDLQLKSINAAGESRQSAWEQLQTDWRKTAESDKEIGGANLQTTLSNVGWLLDTYGDPEVRQVFDLTGAGNNPAMIKFLNRIAGKYREGGSVTPGSPPPTEKSAAQRIFTSMPQ